MKPEEKPTPKPDHKEQEVTLIKPHEHAGKQCQAGDTLIVTDAEKILLKQFGVI